MVQVHEGVRLVGVLQSDERRPGGVYATTRSHSDEAIERFGAEGIREGRDSAEAGQRYACEGNG